MSQGQRLRHSHTHTQRYTPPATCSHESTFFPLHRKEAKSHPRWAESTFVEMVLRAKSAMFRHIDGSHDCLSVGRVRGEGHAFWRSRAGGSALSYPVKQADMDFLSFFLVGGVFSVWFSLPVTILGRVEVGNQLSLLFRQSPSASLQSLQRASPPREPILLQCLEGMGSCG